MQILVSNDDGYLAEGILCLSEELSAIANVTVVAPDRNRSGASNSLTLESPIRAHKHPNGIISVDGTPTDCVHLAITGLLQIEPDMVIAGINAGGNLGDDVIYSGTVAAAVEGRFLGLPAIAVSLVGESLRHYQTAAKAVRILLQKLQLDPLPQDTILNVNVPDVAWNDIQGILSTRLGNRHKSEPVVQTVDPRGRPIYWVGPVGATQDAGEGTDFFAVANNYVSVTPIQVDLTRHDKVESLQDWLQGIELSTS